LFGGLEATAVSSPVEFVQILYFSDFFDIHVSVLRYFFDMPGSLDQSLTYGLAATSYVSNSFFMLVPIAFEYTDNPSHERCSARELASRLKGFEQTTADRNMHFSPSSPRY
jgi:hypothetical protein